MSIRGHRTSIAVEPEFLARLDAMAEREGIGFATLVVRIDRERDMSVPLSSALRLAAFRDALDPSGAPRR